MKSILPTLYDRLIKEGFHPTNRYPVTTQLTTFMMPDRKIGNRGLSHQKMQFSFLNIIGHGLRLGFLDILKESKMHEKLLTRTSSGIGMVVRRIHGYFSSHVHGFNDHQNNDTRAMILIAQIAGIGVTRLNQPMRIECVIFS
ncbi:MAG: hypothetical protein HQL75_01670 [Magnetococcales bacterium]|nr:hypothetical protein [Magnetococcales bacterium]